MVQVTIEQIIPIVGRLQIENDILRGEIARLQALVEKLQESARRKIPEVAAE